MKITCAFLLLSFLSVRTYGQSPVNLALGQPAVASSVESTGYEASKATDGDNATKWSSTSENYKNWLYVDLGKKCDFNKVVVKWGDGYYSSSYDIQISDDASTWVTIYSTPVSSTVSDVSTIDGLIGSARYVKMNGRGRGKGTRYRISEMEVYNENYPTVEEQQVCIDTVTNRLIAQLISTTVNESSVTSLVGSMRADGSWADVDYTTVGLYFPAGTHLYRLTEMAVAYRKPGNSFYGSATLRDKICLGLSCYVSKNPKSTNWWYNEIGGPKNYMLPLILLKGKISEAELLSHSSYLREQTGSYAGEGKNLTWIANISLYKGCIENSYRILATAVRAIYSTLVIASVDGSEGVKIDYSFHQHHAQLMSGAYGLMIITDFSDLIKLTQGISLSEMLTPEKIQILSDVLLKGHQRLGYRNVMDFGSMGRGLATPKDLNYSNITSAVLENIKLADTSKVADYQAWQEHLAGAVFPEKYRGNYHFWKSDIMTQHGAGYYLSARIISKRTYGSECINRENPKGYNLPLGTTNILTDGNEYIGIFPIWDWTKIPGTTTESNQDSTALDGYLIGSNDFGGGVSQGGCGVMAYESNYRKVQAKKAYFFMNDAMLCLGAGINANANNPILTTVNQTFQSGEVYVHKTTTGTRQFSSSFTSSDGEIDWVHHRNVGYIFPDGGLLSLKKVSQTGAWKDIYGAGSSALLSGNVFSLWLSHGNNPVNSNYQYIVVPDKTLHEFEATAATNQGFVVIQNNSVIQAVHNTVDDQYGVVFYGAGSVELSEGLTLSSDKKALVLIDKDSTDLNISVSDPTYSQTSIKLTLNKKLAGNNVLYANNSSMITVNLPKGDNTGSSVSDRYVIDEPDTQISNPVDDGSVNMYSNASTGEIFVRFDAGVYSSAELFDSFGRSLHKNSISASENLTAFSVRDTPSSVYFIRLYGKMGVTVGKVVKR